MRAPMKATVLLLSAILVLGSFGLASGQAVYVDADEIVGLNENGMIPEGGGDLVIPVRFTNATDMVTCLSNGYVFSGENVTFNPIDTVGLPTWNTAYPWNLSMAMLLWFAGGMVGPMPTNADCYFDMMTDINLFPNGIGFAGLTGTGLGLPNGFDDVAYTITVTGVAGDAGGTLTMDSSYWEPGNIWVWCNESGVEVSWGGPYTFEVDGYVPPPEPYTDCWPQPSILKALENDRILEFRIYNEDVDNVDQGSIRVGNIPPYTGVTVEDGVITTDAFIMRFLGASGFRPIPDEGIQSTYTVYYDYISGGSNELIGDFVLQITQADVNFDGVADINDIQFMADYLWHNGQGCELFGYEMMEMMDVDGNGQFDIRDVRKAIEIIL